MLSAVLLTGAASLAFTGGASAATYTPASGPALQAAVAAANVNPGPDTIELADTTYVTTSTITITDTLRITGDHASQAAGGGPRIDGSSILPLQTEIVVVCAGVTATFEAFTLTESGSASAAIRDRGTLLAQNIAITGNAGVQLALTSGAAATLTNSSISDGALAAVTATSASLTLRNSTVAYNGQGGVLFNTPSVIHLNNTIVAKNDGSDFGSRDCSRAVAAQVSSLDSDGTCGVSITADPLLGASALNGGPTPTLAPGAGSPAINAGNAGVCPGTDQRFFLRSGACDIGAYEVGAVRDTTPPTCVVTAIRAGPPKEQDVSAQDGGGGLGPAAISGLFISNGAVAYAPFPAPSNAPLVLSATKTDQSDTTVWSFTATDWAGNATFCI